MEFILAVRRSTASAALCLLCIGCGDSGGTDAGTPTDGAALTDRGSASPVDGTVSADAGGTPTTCHDPRAFGRYYFLSTPRDDYYFRVGYPSQPNLVRFCQVAFSTAGGMRTQSNNPMVGYNFSCVTPANAMLTQGDGGANQLVLGRNEVFGLMGTYTEVTEAQLGPCAALTTPPTVR